MTYADDLAEGIARRLHLKEKHVEQLKPLQNPWRLQTDKGILLKKLLICAMCLGRITAPSLGLPRSVTSIETYGPVPATQVYDGLGIVITPTNAWEYAAAQAAHMTWGRFDCSWDQVEIQRMPSNTSGGYQLPGACAAGLASSKTYGVHPLMDALYGPPYSPIVVGTTTADVPIGATTLDINVTSGSLSAITPGSTYVAIQSGYLSPKFSYPGVLITSISGNTLTLASAASTALPQGATLTLNVELYPPVIIPPTGNALNNSSLLAYGNYATFLAQQLASSGNTGVISIWNEPTWHWDKWDHGVELYDNPPANNDISSSLGVELPLYLSTMKTVPGASFNSGYTETAMWSGSLFYPATYAHANLASIQGQFGTESFHTYGNNPEDYIWNPVCVAANATPELVGNIVAGDCTPVGLWTGATISAAVATQSYPGMNGGIRHSVTETGICRSCTAATETQVTRYDIREFLALHALGISPIYFYRMSGDTDWEWFSSTQTPYPVYTAFQSLMTDIGSIAQPPLVACPPCSTPAVSSYTGFYPLATITLAGARAGDHANSLLYYTWQRSYGLNGYNWASVPSPASVPVSVTIPAGMTVASVKDTVTLTPVIFSFSAGELTYGVADDPIEVLLTPIASPLMSVYLVAKGHANTIVLGGTLQFAAWGIYSDGSVVELPDAQGDAVTLWNTSNHSVAKISTQGHATALGLGTVNIEATVGTIKATPLTVTVVAP